MPWTLTDGGRSGPVRRSRRATYHVGMNVSTLRRSANAKNSRRPSVESYGERAGLNAQSSSRFLISTIAMIAMPNRNVITPRNGAVSTLSAMLATKQPQPAPTGESSLATTTQFRQAVSL